MIEVFVLDDQQVVREGLKELLEEEPDINLSGQAGTCRELMEILDSKTPDVIVLDINMPDRNGLDVLKDLKVMYPHIPVLLMSVYDENQFATRSIEAGASAYLNKMNVPDELPRAIRQLAGEGKYTSAEVAERLGWKQDEL